MPLTWPATLPQAPGVGFSDTIGNATVRTETDSGAAKVRPRFTESIDQMVWPLALTSAEWTALKAFYKTTTKGGSLAFSITHPLSSVSVNCRILTPPSFTHQGGDMYRGSVSMEIIP